MTTIGRGQYFLQKDCFVPDITQAEEIQKSATIEQKHKKNSTKKNDKNGEMLSHKANTNNL